MAPDFGRVPNVVEKRGSPFEDGTDGID
jgi:hypothetical protein